MTAIKFITIFTLFIIATQAEPQEPDSKVPINPRAPRLDERQFKYSAIASNSGSGVNGIHTSDVTELKQQQDLSKFMNTRNLVKTLVKLVFGGDEESAATSRQILNLLVTVLDMLKTTFGSRVTNRSGHQGRSLRGTLDEAAVASVSMLKGFVRSAMTKDENCMQKYLCEASKEAVKEGHEIGYLVAQFGGYAASYALEAQKSMPFSSNFNATRSGRSGDDCFKLYQSCNEAD